MKNHRGVVAVILATSVGAALLMALAFTLGPWTPDPAEAVAMEVLALIAAGLGALSVYIGMTLAGAGSADEEDPLTGWGDWEEHDDDPEVEEVVEEDQPS